MATLPRTFPEVREAIEAALSAGQPQDAERLVTRLQDKARQTRSREQEALAWFAKGLVEDGTRQYVAAEQSLLVAVGIGRELFKDLNESLGHIARSLGIVYAHLDRPDSAAEMFLLARNVFLKTEPQLAPEVVRFAASCNIALKLPEQALAIVHQELGAPEELSTPRTPEELDLYLVRARAFKEQNKPVQALKALARLTQLLMPEPHARIAVARAWLAIAETWAERCDRGGAWHAYHCAALVAGGDEGPASVEIGRAAPKLALPRIPFEAPLAWRAQRVMGTAVAFASPTRGLFFEQSSHRLRQFSPVAAEHLPDGQWALRFPLKLIHGRFDHWATGDILSRGATLRGTMDGARFETGEAIHLDDGLLEPSVRTVLFAVRSKVVLDSTPLAAPHALSAVFPTRLRQVVGTSWAPTAHSISSVLRQDDLVNELLASEP